MADDQEPTVEQLQAQLLVLHERHAVALAENASLRHQQAATADIRRVIAASPNDLQPVLDATAEMARRLSGADYANIVRRQDNGNLPFTIYDTSGLQHVATPPYPLPADASQRGHVASRAMLEQRTIYLPDVLAEPDGEYEISKELSKRYGNRTLLVVSLIRNAASIGYLSIVNRDKPRPFTARQIALVETFADQAAIAIEIARLFALPPLLPADGRRPHRRERLWSRLDVCGHAADPLSHGIAVRQLTDNAGQFCHSA